MLDLSRDNRTAPDPSAQPIGLYIDWKEVCDLSLKEAEAKEEAEKQEAENEAGKKKKRRRRRKKKKLDPSDLYMLPLYRMKSKEYHEEVKKTFSFL